MQNVEKVPVSWPGSIEQDRARITALEAEVANLKVLLAARDKAIADAIIDRDQAREARDELLALKPPHGSATAGVGATCPECYRRRVQTRARTAKATNAKS